MIVVIIFKSADRKQHNGQEFEVTAWEVHTYNFLRLQFADGAEFRFNMEDIFSFQVFPNRDAFKASKK